MVKLQKPIPKSLGNKPKLDNPIKQKKQQLKKDKSAITKKAKLLDDSTPVKEAKIALKTVKEVIEKKQHKKEVNGEKKGAKKPLILTPESPQQIQQNGKGKKNKVANGKNVVTNGVEKAATEAPQKANKKAASVQKAPVSEKPVKSSKQVKAPVVKEVPAPVKPAKANKVKAALAPAKPAASEKESSVPAPAKSAKAKKGKAAPAPAPAKNIASEKETVVPAPVKSAKPSKVKAAPASAKSAESIVPPPAKSAKQTKVKALPVVAAASKKEVIVPVPSKVAEQKKLESVAPQKNAAKQGKKQKNKKKNASAPEIESTPAIKKVKKVKKPKEALQEKKKAKIAFKKSKLAGKDDPKKDVKAKVGPTFRYDPIPYDEEKFNEIVNTENIKKIAQALKTIVEKEVKTKKSSIFDDYRYFLQVASFKIPSCPKRMVRLNLKHSLVDKDDDVLLVVPDLQRGGKVDYEPTKHHYEDLLRQKGVEGITVMPMNQLRKEFRTFEQKRRLCASYEYFMCDGRIVAHVGAIVGKITQKTRNTFHAVRLNEEKDIKAEIEKSLKRTAFRQLAKSSLQSIPVGSHKFSAEQLAENIELVVAQLKKVFPGGLGNIRNLHLKIGLTGTSSLPLYISMAQAPDETPMVIGPKEERMIKLKREANEVLSKFSMTKEGKLIKLTRSGVERKRKLNEMKAALKEDEDEEPTKKAQKDAKESAKDGKKAKKLKELEVAANEAVEDDDSSDEDDDDDIQLEEDSVDEETEEETESGVEIVENGFVDEDDEESEEDDEQEGNQSGNDEDDDDDEEEDDDDDDEEEDDDDEAESD